MTITPEALEALSKAATQGEWEATERDGYHEVLAPDNCCDWYGRPKCHAVLYGDTEVDESGENAAFIVALVNLYRTGHLILVDDAAVERVAELVELSLLRHGVHQTAVEGTRDDAKDILAALQVKP